MKTGIKILLIITLLLMGFKVYPQDPVKEKVKKKTEKKADEKVDEALDKGLNKFGKLFNKKKKNEKKSSEKQIDESTGKEVKENPSAPVSSEPTLKWAKYDFLPGDKVIFEDNLLEEENGEFPSRWDLARGNTEVAVFGDEKVIMMRDGHPSIVPYLKNPEQDYLPEVFTVEMDLYHPANGNFQIFLYDRKNQEDPSSTGWSYLQVTENEFSLGQSSSRHPDKSLDNKPRWMHIAIAYTSGKFKAYMDETRLINIPHLDFNPIGLTLYTYHANNNNPYYVKNIRIAEGGVKYYDRFLQDGKIVSNAIRFDVNKATLKPESMGAINEIYDLLKDHPEVKFSIEGHTDSDGDDDFNLKLSEKRAEKVKNKLVQMGIDEERLTFTGHGEKMPVSDNSTPEGKANNRRVEFVKI